MTACVLLLASVVARDNGQQVGPGRQPVVVVQAVCLPLCYTDAASVAKKLTATLGGGNDGIFYADERTNRVVIVAGDVTAKRAAEIVRRLDVKTDCCLHVVPLKNADAAWAAKGMRAALLLLTLLGDDHGVYVTADERANGVIISAGEERAEAIKKLLRWLDGQGR
jgi:type II secretory pathway component GspD/PulD (secretin)